MNFPPMGRCTKGNYSMSTRQHKIVKYIFFVLNSVNLWFIFLTFYSGVRNDFLKIEHGIWLSYLAIHFVSCLWSFKLNVTALILIFIFNGYAFAVHIIKASQGRNVYDVGFILPYLGIYLLFIILNIKEALEIKGGTK